MAESGLSHEGRGKNLSGRVFGLCNPMTPRRQSARNAGILLLLAGTLVVALADASAKWLTASYPTSQIIFVRATTGLVLVTLFIALFGKFSDLRSRRLHWHGVRAGLITVTMLGVYYALAHIPMVEVEAIGHAAPFFVGLLSPWFVRERVTGHNWLAIAIGFIGILIILRPDPERFHIAHVYMFFCALSYALLILIARRISDTEGVLAINFYIYPLTVAVTGFIASNVWVPPSPADWGMFLLQGLFATAATLLFIAGVRHVEAALAATLDYSTLIWVSIIGFTVWGESPDALTAVGILLIVASGIYVVRHSTRQIDESIVQTSEH
jgi:drug/metabolite transporter (DMT)-like permease